MPVDEKGGAEGGVDELVRARFFPNQNEGVLVEVGAAHPEFLSVSASYRQRGWRVVSVEPNPEFCELHRAAGHDVLQFACGDHDEDGVEFSMVDSRGTAYKGGNVSYESFSSLAIKDEYASLIEADSNLVVKKITVDLRRLDTLLAEYAPEVDRIDIIAADVEGWELEVLEGLNFDRYRPRVLVIENLFAARSYRDYMRAKGYELWRYVEPNDVYAARSEIGPRDRIARTLAHLELRAGQLLDGLKRRLGV